MVTKHCKDRGGISLSIKKEGNHESDTRDDTNSNQVEYKYLLQFWVTMKKKL